MVLRENQGAVKAIEFNLFCDVTDELVFHSLKLIIWTLRKAERDYINGALSVEYWGNSVESARVVAVSTSRSKVPRSR